MLAFSQRCLLSQIVLNYEHFLSHINRFNKPYKMPDLASSGPLLVFDFDCTIIHVDGDDEVNCSVRSHKWLKYNSFFTGHF